ncbi:MAG: CsgG/HfaB family protein [Elusimicrobia bacterium]|nr:CsgG/HfaB family protein [Elusimicrobiota bacterium]
MLPFRNDSSDDNKLGLRLNDLFAERLARVRGIKLVERERLAAIMEEMHLGDIFADPKTAVTIGNLVGANVLALGSYAKAESNHIVTVRLVKVETGEIIGGVEDSGQNFERLADILAARLAQSLTPHPASPR